MRKHKSIVVALGGNALAPPGARVSIQEQFLHTRESLGVVVELIQQGERVAIVHGNGPQVGHELVRNECAIDVVEPLPLGVLVASTAGWIGYMIQQSLQNALLVAGLDREVVTVITQTVVDADDPALAEPTKPIGSVLDEERAAKLRANGIAVGADASGRLRRLACSPTPRGIVERNAIRDLIDGGRIVVAAGGGGTPVKIRADGCADGVDAVVDKDRTAAALGVELAADTLLILTNVDAVYRDWGTEDATPIRRMSADEAEAMMRAGAVGVGSMGPKLGAAVSFVRGGGRAAVIAALDDGRLALQGKAGTTITGDPQ